MNPSLARALIERGISSHMVGLQGIWFEEWPSPDPAWEEAGVRDLPAVTYAFVCEKCQHIIGVDETVMN